MFWKHTRALVPLLTLLTLLVLLSGCGSNVSGQTGNAPATQIPPDRLPESLQITPGGPGIVQETRLTLNTLTLVQQLYKTMLALPVMPDNMGCPADAGPSYQLVFLSRLQTLAEADAHNGGCGTVMISGEKQERLASQSFWSQIHQDIDAAIPPPQVQSLAIQQTLPGNRPVLTAHITDAASAQRLYNTLLAQPVSNAQCSASEYPTYQIVFQAAKQVIAASISQQCQTIFLNGLYQSSGGTYSLTGNFQQVFTQTLAEASFAPAQPDQMSKDIQLSSGTTVYGPVSDLSLVQRLYTSIFTLPSAIVGPDCPSATDKLNHTETIYTLNFSQWGLPVMDLSVYKGLVCQLINPSPGMVTNQTLRGDTAFWNLLNLLA